MAASVGASGVNVTETSALSIMTVLACVGLLADAVSTLPIDAFRFVPNGRKEITPKPSLIERPNQEMTRQDFFAQVALSMALRGNFYGYKTDFDADGFPQQIVPIHPDTVNVRRNRDTGLREYRIGFELIDSARILHIPYITIPGSLVGINPIEYCRQGIALAIATEMFGTKFFSNGTQASGVIEVERSLSPEEALAMASAWAQAHQGLDKAHLPAVLTEGAKWQQLSVNPDDAQFLETRAFQRAEIAMMFRVPPHMIGDVDRTTSWGTGIEQQEMGFVTNTLTGYTGRVEQAFSPLIPGGPKTFCKFNLRARLRGDTLQRFQAYTMARNGTWMNPDEIRELEDMPPLPDEKGQDYYAPLNYAPVGSAPAAPVPTGTQGVVGSSVPLQHLDTLVADIVRRELDVRRHA